jgi:eukaryotic-like serine/threonine-protein kinase
MDPTRRAAFLGLTCGDDIALRSEVESLLIHDEAAANFIGSPALAVAAKLFAADLTAPMDAATFNGSGCAIGPYRLLERIGEGGMGEVWLAEQTYPVRRRVALKLVKAGMDTREVIARFETERQALALMDHPIVAKVFDGGSTTSGRPYFVMEYVPGVPITEWCKRHRLTVAERLELFVQVCEGVKHAHQKAIIHRDLKPSNILVTEVDGRAAPKIIDFGIAKAVLQKLSQDTLRTRAGAILGTPEYMSPEQADSAGNDIDTRSDVYSLGVILYELLVGAAPIDLRKLTFEEMLRKLREADPPVPSSRVRTLGEHSTGICEERHTEPRTLERRLRGDLDSIVMKALEKQRERRYSGPAELSADIGRYLRHEPVMARPQRSWYRTARFIRRHRWAVGAAASVALALAAGLGAALWEAHVARTQAQVAANEAQTSAAVEQFIADIFETNSRDRKDPLKARETTARQLLDIGARKIEHGLDKAPAAKERMLLTLADLYYGLGLDDEAVALSQKRVAVARTLYGPNDPRVAAALTYLGASMHVTQAVTGREAVLLEAKRILDSNRDFSSPLRGRLLFDLAEHYTTWDSKKALDYASQAVALYRRLPPSEEFAKALYYQAWAYSLSPDYVKAEAAYAESLSVAQRTGAPKGDLPKTEAGLARANAKLLHYDDAKKNLELAFETARSLNGARHVDAIETEARLGEFLSMTSQFTEGLSHLANALTVCLQLKGPDDSFFTPQILLMNGEALRDSGHFEEGLASISRAVENRRKNRPGTRYLGEMLIEQASALADLGEYEKARLCLDEAAALSGKAGFKLNAGYTVARLQLAFDLKKPEEASAMIESFYGPVPDAAPLSLELLGNLTARAQLALATNDSEGALRWATRLSDAVTVSPNRKYLRQWEERAAIEQGSAWLQMHHPERALESLMRADRLAGEIYDSTSAELIPAKAALGFAYLEMGNRSESMKLLAQAESIHKFHPHLGERLDGRLRQLRQALNPKNAIAMNPNGGSNEPARGEQ